MVAKNPVDMNKFQLVRDLTSSYEFNIDEWSMTVREDIDSMTVSAIKSFYSLYSTEEKPKPDKVTIVISSPGGNIFAAFAIIDLMNWMKKNHSLETDILVLGTAFSAAALIAINATGIRYMTKHSYLMLHDIQSMSEEMASGADVESKAVYVREIKETFIEFLTTKTSLTKEWVLSKIKSDILFNLDRAISSKLIDTEY